MTRFAWRASGPPGRGRRPRRRGRRVRGRGRVRRAARPAPGRTASARRAAARCSTSSGRRERRGRCATSSTGEPGRRVGDVHARVLQDRERVARRADLEQRLRLADRRRRGEVGRRLRATSAARTNRPKAESGSPSSRACAPASRQARASSAATGRCRSGSGRCGSTASSCSSSARTASAAPAAPSRWSSCWAVASWVRHSAMTSASTAAAAASRARRRSTGPGAVGRPGILRCQVDARLRIELGEQGPVRRLRGGVPVLPAGQLRLQARGGGDVDAADARQLGQRPGGVGLRPALRATSGAQGGRCAAVTDPRMSVADRTVNGVDATAVNTGRRECGMDATTCGVCALAGATGGALVGFGGRRARRRLHPGRSERGPGRRVGRIWPGRRRGSRRRHGR